MFLVVQSRRRLRKNIQWGERHSLSFTLFKNIKNIFSCSDTCVQIERKDRYQQKCVPYSPCKKTSKAPYCSNVNKMRSWRVRKEKPCCIQQDPDYCVIAFEMTFCYEWIIYKKSNVTKKRVFLEYYLLKFCYTLYNLDGCWSTFQYSLVQKLLATGLQRSGGLSWQYSITRQELLAHQ